MRIWPNHTKIDMMLNVMVIQMII